MGRRAWWGRAAIAAVVALLFALYLAWPEGLVLDAIYVGVIGGAGIVAIFGARRREGAERAAWGWIAFGACLSGLGEVLFTLYMHVRGFEPDISIADGPWLASYLAIAIGLLLLLRAAHGDWKDIDGLIDMAVVGVVSLLIVWQVVLQATVTDTSIEPGVRAVWASYPILDAALMALVVRAATNRRTRSLAMWLVVAGVSCWLFADFFFMLFPASSAWERWLGTGWMAAAVLLATATWVRTPAPRITVERIPDYVGPMRIAFAIAPLLVPGVIEVVTYTRGVDPDPVPLLAASVVLAGLAFARAFRLLRASQTAETDLRTTEQRFRALVQRSADAALILDADGVIRYVSTAATGQVGYLPDDLVGQTGWDLIHPDDLENAITELGPIPTGAFGTTELRVKDADGGWRWVEEIVTNLIDDPAVKGVVVNVRDISQRKAAEQELLHIANYDGLTQLANRRRITEELEQLLSGGTPVALLVFNLDHFKFVNESRGRETGDLVLTGVAERLGAALPEGDSLGRLDGDEFVLVCAGIADWATAKERGRLVHEVLGNPFELAGRGRFHVSVSIGIALGRAGCSADQLLQEADTAMYASKSVGPASSVAYDGTLRAAADERLTVEHDLRGALRSDELIVHYQPVIDLATGQTDSVEALVRWRHPTRGILLPGAFIPIAEQSALIDGIGSFVLRQACSDAAYWAHVGSPLPVAVNISAVQLGNEHLAATIRATLHDTGLAPELLILEVTETALLVGADLALANVEAFRAMGVRVALDDFGTGYSSLAYLKDVPADIVKIDRSFVEGVADSPVDRDIVKAIIDLAHALGRDVVAEGVETDAQLQELRRLGCPFAQGFLWAFAIPAADILARVRPERDTVPTR